MFQMEVTAEDQLLAHRIYDRAGDCCQAMITALEYYIKKSQQVEIAMKTQAGVLVIRIDNQWVPIAEPIDGLKI